MANTTRRKNVSAEQESTDEYISTQETQKSVEQSTDNTSTSDECMDEYSTYWNKLESGKFETYIMNIKNGSVVMVSNKNGISTCYVPNVRFENGEVKKII